MRLKAPEHIGHPVIGGVEIKPDADGVYHVEHHDHIEHMLATGFIDVDAPKKKITKAGQRANSRGKA